MVRVFDGVGDAIISQHPVDAEILGEVRVLINESADQGEAVAMLLRIASWIENEARQTAEGGAFLEDN